MEGVGGDEDERRQLQPKQSLAGGQVYCERTGAAALSRSQTDSSEIGEAAAFPLPVCLVAALIGVTTARHGGSTGVSSRPGTTMTVPSYCAVKVSLIGPSRVEEGPIGAALAGSSLLLAHKGHLFTFIEDFPGLYCDCFCK